MWVFCPILEGFRLLAEDFAIRRMPVQLLAVMVPELFRV